MGFSDSQPTFMIFEKSFRFGIGIGVLLKRYNNAPVKAGVKLRGKNLGWGGENFDWGSATCITYSIDYYQRLT